MKFHFQCDSKISFLFPRPAVAINPPSICILHYLMMAKAAKMCGNKY